MSALLLSADDICFAGAFPSVIVLVLALSQVSAALGIH